jgi:RNA polymerase sigma-70 factor, ECF subfamily
MARRAQAIRHRRMASANPLYMPLHEHADALGRQSLRALIDDLTLSYTVVDRESRPLCKHLPSLREARRWACDCRDERSAATTGPKPKDVIGAAVPRTRHDRRMRGPALVPDAPWHPLRVVRPTPRLTSMVQLAIRSHPSMSVSADGEVGPALDRESRDWLGGLSATGPRHEAAVERLHALLLRAARFEVARRQRAVGPSGGSGDLDDLAMDAADDALVAILSKLHTYRGDGRFTTWAYKFALLEAAVKVRRRRWHGRELPLEADGWAQLSDDRQTTPDGQAEASELIDAVRDAIAEVLTPHQRAVLVAITLNDVPIDVLAERRGTTRGALYKTLHDARRKLRARLAQDGLAIEPSHERQPT